MTSRSTHEIHLARLTDQADPAWCWTIVDASERQRAEALASEALRRRYLLGHGLLRLTLGAWMGIPPAEIIFDRDECRHCHRPHGKPHVRGADDVEFSFSRSGDHVMIAVGAAPVGVDVEEALTESTARQVLRSMHPREAAAAAGDPRGIGPATTRLWTRTEAVLKCHGAGLLVEPGSFDIASADLASVEGQEVVVADVPSWPGTSAAVAFMASATAECLVEEWSAVADDARGPAVRDTAVVTVRIRS